MSDVIHFEYRANEYADNLYPASFVKKIGCGAHKPNRKVKGLDTVTCGRCKRSRSYKAYRAFVLGLIDKKMLREIGLGFSGKLA